MPHDADDFAPGGIDGLDYHVGMNRQCSLQPGLQGGRIGPVLAQPGAGGQQSKNRPPIGIARLHHRLGDKAIVDQLVVEGFLATAAQRAGGGQRAERADRQGEGGEWENDLQGEPVAELRHVSADVTCDWAASLCRPKRSSRRRRRLPGSDRGESCVRGSQRRFGGHRPERCSRA